VLEPELPQILSTGWAEFVRQIAGPFMVCVVAVLLDAGLRPWWIPLPGWGALLVGFMGVVLWVSGISLPQNPVICRLVGKRGLTDSGSRIFSIVIGIFLFLLAMGIILYPINQSIPEVPEWILNS
jgi:small neutral amino acid transporter SnatA (MarC family)